MPVKGTRVGRRARFSDARVVAASDGQFLRGRYGRSGSSRACRRHCELRTPPRVTLMKSPSFDIEPEATDEELMEDLVNHDPEPLERLYERYAPVLKTVIMRVIHDEAESEDVLQEVFLQVWGRAKRYSPAKGKLLGWLVTLARRRAIDRLRKRRAYRRATDRLEWESRLPVPGERANGFQRQIFQDDLREILSRKIEALPAFQKEAIRLAFFEGMSQREISAVTQIPLGTIKTRIELGMRKLAVAVLAQRAKIE